jgi:serine/threonine-protein kinase
MDDDVRERFSTEARTLASLSHPHIVPIFDYVEREGLCLIVMEQLPRGSLWDRFSTTGLALPNACALVIAACAALQHAHERQVLHLDVKPDNLLFDRDNVLKVTDFGISSVIGGGRTLGTVDGTVLGTPAYMAPEQARGDVLSPATDTYATGVMLYELLSGQLPFSGASTAAELLQQRLEEDPTALRDVAPRVPEPIAEVAMRSLGREPDERYVSAEELGVALGEAAASAWGDEWLDVAGVPILGAPALTIAAHHAPHHAGGEPGAAGFAPPSMSLVRAGSVPRIEGVDLNRIGRNDLVDVEDLLEPPAPPTRALLVTGALVVLALFVALVGIGGPRLHGTLDHGTVRVAGQDITTGATVRLNLSHDVRVAIDDPDLARRVDAARLHLSSVGIPLGTADAPVIGGVAVIDPKRMAVIASGAVKGEITLSGDHETVAHQEFEAHATNPWYLSAFGIGAVLVLLVAFANVESALKPLLKGRRRRLSPVGAAVWASVAGFGITTLVAAVGISQMTLATIVIVVLLSAAAGAAACPAAAGIGRRRRLQRAMRRAERTFRARTTAAPANTE